MGIQIYLLTGKKIYQILHQLVTFTISLKYFGRSILLRTSAPGDFTRFCREKYGLTLWIILEIILFYHYLHVKMN